MINDVDKAYFTMPEDERSTWLERALKALKVEGVAEEHRIRPY